MLVDDQNKKCLFYGSTLQKSLRDNPPRSKMVSAPSRLEKQAMRGSENIEIQKCLNLLLENLS